jgi:hypothetical protein
MLFKGIRYRPGADYKELSLPGLQPQVETPYREPLVPCTDKLDEIVRTIIALPIHKTSYTALLQIIYQDSDGGEM